MRIGRPLNGRIDIADMALREWAEEVGRGQGLPGLSSESLLSRIIRQGPSAASQSGGTAPSMSDVCRGVDRAVAELQPKEFRVVRVWYLGTLSKPYIRMNQPLCARELSLSYRTFQRLLKNGREHIADMLGII